MNKKEFIEKLREHGAWCTECHDINGKKDRYVKAAKVRELLDQLDEPQHDTTKIPQIIAKYLELCKTDNFDFTEDYNLVSYDFINHFDTDLTIEEMEEIKMWFYDNDQKENQRRHILFLQAYTYGYEVEKEPKWIVSYSTMYLKSPLETGQIETVEITPKKELACHFKSYKEAKQQTSLIGGAVEKVEV